MVIDSSRISISSTKGAFKRANSETVGVKSVNEKSIYLMHANVRSSHRGDWHSSISFISLNLTIWTIRNITKTQ